MKRNWAFTIGLNSTSNLSAVFLSPQVNICVCMCIISFCHLLLVLLRCSKLRNAGQTCVSANRVLVQSKVYDKFASLVKAAFEKVKCGNGLDPDVAVGMNGCKLLFLLSTRHIVRSHHIQHHASFIILFVLFVSVCMNCNCRRFMFMFI